MAHTLLAVPLASNHIMHPSTVDDCLRLVETTATGSLVRLHRLCSVVRARRDGVEPTVTQDENEKRMGA